MICSCSIQITQTNLNSAFINISIDSHVGWTSWTIFNLINELTNSSLNLLLIIKIINHHFNGLINLACLNLHISNIHVMWINYFNSMWSSKIQGQTELQYNSKLQCKKSTCFMIQICFKPKCINSSISSYIQRFQSHTQVGSGNKNLWNNLFSLQWLEHTHTKKKSDSLLNLSGKRSVCVLRCQQWKEKLNKGGLGLWHSTFQSNQGPFDQASMLNNCVLL